MQRELGMSDAVYGAGAGIFFIGYFLFEVPSNMVLQRIGARMWIGPIMIVWGALSALTMFVTGPISFYILRFFLGIVESGFFPGVILYLTFWFTNKYRAKMVAMFMTGIPLSGALTGPISGWILARMSGVGHLHAWQWLFLVEGIPSLLAGVLTLIYLTDNPAKAAWLDAREKRMVTENLRAEEELKKRTGPGHHKLSDAFRSVDVWILGIHLFRLRDGELRPRILASPGNPRHPDNQSPVHRMDFRHPLGSRGDRNGSGRSSLRCHRRTALAPHTRRNPRSRRLRRQFAAWNIGYRGLGSADDCRHRNRMCPVPVLDVADGHSFGRRRGGRYRLDQFDRKSFGLRQSLFNRHYQRPNA